MRAVFPVIASSILLSLGGQAFAQTVTQDSSVRNGASTASEDIVVTARHREERLQDVPISISAIRGDTLADRQINTTEALTQVVANLQFSPVAPSSGNNFTSAIFIRGVGQTDFIASTDPGVGFYIDSVYFARASGTAVALLDVDRVEVLRGPQGTLFGRNTVGGAVQVISNKPTLDSLSGRISGTVGDFNRREAVGVLNIPLSNTFGIRAAAIVRSKDGYVRNVLNGRDLANVDGLAMRVSALWNPAPNFDLLWVNDYTNERSNGSPTVFAGINTAAPFVRQAAANAGCPGFTFPPTPAAPVPENTDPRCPNNQYLALGPYRVASEAPTSAQLEMFGSALTATWQLSDQLTLRSISGYRHTSPYSLRDADNTPFRILETINKDDVEQFTQEFQALGEAFDHRLHWQAGAYYFRETDQQFYPVYLPSRISSTTGEELQNGGVNSAADIKNTSYAFFTQETLDITDALNLTVGVRYTNDTKDATPHLRPSPSIAGFLNVGYNAPNPTPLTGLVCLGPPRSPGTPCTGSSVALFNEVLNERQDHKVTPMATLQYRWSPGLMTYASYSEGYKSGGFNTRIIQPVIGPNAPTGREFLPAFDPESVTAYEIGAKIDINHFARFSAAAFRSRYQDIQIVVREGVAPVVRNAGSATIDGVELEGHLTPTRAFEADVGVGYTHFQYERFTNALNAGQAALAPHALGRVDLDDQQAYTPELSATVGLSYTFDLGSGELVARADGAYRSKTYFDAPNTEQIAQPAYSVYNASLRYNAPGDRFAVTAGVSNFADKAYRVSGNSSLTAASGYAESVYAPPRQWFVETSFHF